MKFEENGHWEAHIQQIANEFVYPPTPAIVHRVAGRLHKGKRSRSKVNRGERGMVLRLRPLWAFVLLITMLFATLWSIPAVRAAVTEWFALGAVRIWLVEPPDMVPTQPISAEERTTTSIRQIAPTAIPLSAVTDLAGETTLKAAQDSVDFPIRLPKIPADLGEPDHVYLQRAEGDMVILVWMLPEQPAAVRMSLHLLGPGAFVWKMQPADTIDAQVNGAQAYWTQGPYYIKAGHGQSWGNVRLVEGGVLIWVEGEMTYRLESDMTLAEALRVAESLGR